MRFIFRASRACPTTLFFEIKTERGEKLERRTLKGFCENKFVFSIATNVRYFVASLMVR